MNIDKKKANERANAWKKRHPEQNKEISRIYREANREKLREAGRAYREKNKEKVGESKRIYAEKNSEVCAIRVKEYKKLHPEKAREYMQKRRATDLQFKLKLQLRHRINMAVKGNFRGGSAVRSLGCSISEFKLYLENLFQPGMSWENWAHKGWHLDHKKPISNFDLTKESEVAEACHYTNLQPLWWFENLKKSNKTI